MSKVKDIISNLSGVSVGTWVRLILMMISLVNMALVALGKAPVSVQYEEVYALVSIVLSVAVGIASYWKNNSFTKAAQEADEYLHAQGTAIEDSGYTEEAE